MKIAVLGTGVVGQTLARKLASLGHEVSLGTRDPAAAAARTAPGTHGGSSLADYLAANPAIRLARFDEAAAGAAVIVHATNGEGALAALGAAGAENLADKVLLDVSNPLDFSKGFPPTLSVCNDDSLAERIQRAFPRARVVKSLNTVNANLMVEPAALAGGDHTMFLCGDDAAAKETVAAILRSFGWTDLLDLGGLSMARGTEMYLPLWVRMFGALKTPMFSVKVVR